MTNLITNKFREHLASQLVESITEAANNVYYLLTSKHTEYAGNDSIIPLPVDSFVETEQAVYSEGIFAKKITSSDIAYMVPRYEWSANTIYSQYDQDDGELFSKQFYVSVDSGSTYYVYKCLDNNRGVASVEQPTSTSETACNFITTSDGYTWKLMYSLPEATFEKFATDEYMPVVTSANISSSSISGALDVVYINYTGSNYVANLTGQFQVDDLREAIPTVTGNTTTYRLSTSASSNANFYVGSALYVDTGTGAGQIKEIISYIAATRVAVVDSAFTTAPDSDSTYIIAPRVVIDGDGSGATAYASVSSNSSVNNFISKINMVSRGSNYTYANARVNGNTAGVSNNAVLKVIVPPIGGHGHDALSELGVQAIGISSTFNTSEGGFITTENDYRKIIILKDPLINNVTLGLDSEEGSFSVGENIYQVDKKTLIGTVSGNTTSTTLTGQSTQFNTALKENDRILITDTVSNTSCLRIVSGVSNSINLTMNDELPFVTSFATISHVSILASGVKIGNASPYITMTNTTPKFVTNKLVVGEGSGAVANVTAITVGEKSYNNWNTLDNRTRISYTGSSGVMAEDSVVFQTLIGTSNAFFHSSNSTYVFLTSEKGPINADPSSPLLQANGGAFFTLGSVKYTPDIVRGTGHALYIENSSPISRSANQSETLRLIIKF